MEQKASRTLLPAFGRIRLNDTAHQRRDGEVSHIANNCQKGRILMDNCVFCGIAAGSIPSKKVYEDDKIVAFHDLNPQAPVHVLFVPKQHICCADKITEDNCDVVAHIFCTIPKVAAELGLTDGYRIVNNCGEHGCQTVKHLHFHLLGGTQLRGSMV